MEPSDLKPGDIVQQSTDKPGKLRPKMDVVSVVCGFATCRWLSYIVTGAKPTPELLERYGVPKFNIFHTSDLVLVPERTPS